MLNVAASDMASDVDMATWFLNSTSFHMEVTTVNGSPVSSNETAREGNTHLYLLMAMLIIFSIVGTFGNIFVLYGFSKMLRQNLTSTVFILTLAGTDLLTTMVIIPFTVYMELVEFKGMPDAVCKAYHFLITGTVPYSIFMMVAIAVDRYLCICRPFLHFMNLRRAKIVVIVLALWAVLLGLIISLFYGVYERTPETISSALNVTEVDANFTLLFPDSNETTFLENYTVMVEENVTRIKYRGFCDRNDLIFALSFQSALQYFHSSLFVIAVIIVGILYGCIFIAVTKRRKKTQKIRSTNSVVYNCNGNSSNRRESVFMQLTQRKRRSSTQESTKRNSRRSERAFVANLRTALTLFIVTLAFIIVFLPGWLMALRLVPFNLFLFYLHLLHNVINPFIYAFMNETFRRVVRKLFACSPARGPSVVIAGMSQTTC